MILLNICNRINRYLYFLILFLVPLQTFSQDKFHIPRNIKACYTDSTRSKLGIPGSNYWQNRPSYIIDAEIFPEQSRIVGELKCNYMNNSPDSLKTLIIHISRFV